MRPVPHCEELLIPKPPEHVTLDEESSDSDESEEEKETHIGDTTFEQSCSSEPHLLNQEDLNDLVLRRKNHLLKQQQLFQELTEALTKKATVGAVQAKHWKLLKIMSRTEEDFKLLETKSRIMCADLSKIGTKLEKTHEALQNSSVILFPSEQLPNDASWTIQGEYETRKALATLRNSENKPSGPVTVISTSVKPILSLSELLTSLAVRKYQLKVKLLDSFWASTTPANDYNRLEAFLKAGHGSYLLSLMGNFPLTVLDSLELRYIRKIGLRIDTAADAAIIHSRQDLKCYRHICVSTKVVPHDIEESIPEGSKLFCLHFVGLQGSNFYWLKEVLHKLLPPNRTASLYFPECSLTAAEVQELLQMVGDLNVVPCV
ncbi:hypothetical protein FHG87_008135 [Trinorchestia longiramus]|nr:hypothetical protein FHG87_008135 [Trinorchestia longiramus]